MTGAEHYREAEWLVNDKPTVEEWRDSAEAAEEYWRLTLAEAQVHATLALVAATAEAGVHLTQLRGDSLETARSVPTAWGEVLGR
jgi:hypothetical protein